MSEARRCWSGKYFRDESSVVLAGGGQRMVSSWHLGSSGGWCSGILGGILRLVLPSDGWLWFRLQSREGTIPDCEQSTIRAGSRCSFTRHRALVTVEVDLRSLWHMFF